MTPTIAPTAPATILITGHTYPVRQQMRDLGGIWNKAANGWDIPAARAEEARAIVASGPARRPSRRPSRANRSAGYTRFAGGGESYRNPRGRCEDAPCCGCCS